MDGPNSILELFDYILILLLLQPGCYLINVISLEWFKHYFLNLLWIVNAIPIWATTHVSLFNIKIN